MAQASLISQCVRSRRTWQLRVQILEVIRRFELLAQVGIRRAPEFPLQWPPRRRDYTSLRRPSVDADRAFRSCLFREGYADQCEERAGNDAPKKSRHESCKSTTVITGKPHVLILSSALHMAHARTAALDGKPRSCSQPGFRAKKARKKNSSVS